LEGVQLDDSGRQAVGLHVALTQREPSRIMNCRGAHVPEVQNFRAGFRWLLSLRRVRPDAYFGTASDKGSRGQDSRGANVEVCRVHGRGNARLRERLYDLQERQQV
jgi:hypothetical protein